MFTDKNDTKMHLPDIDSIKYKGNLKEIEEAVDSINLFTNNLETKVATMMKGQQTQFVKSYKDHMIKVEDCMKNLEDKIIDYEKKIQQYQNQGMISKLMKKIAVLEAQQKKLLTKLQCKDKNTKFLKNQIAMKNKQNLRLEQKIKMLLKQKAKFEISTQRSSLQKQQLATFATEIPQKSHRIAKLNTSLQSIEGENSLMQNYQTLPNPQDKKVRKASNQKQLNILKRKNRELSSVNSRMIDQTSSVQQFFLKITNQLKKKIIGRKKFKECTFEDFKQEDKIQLLIRILSNDEVLRHLYEKIFGNKHCGDIEISSQLNNVNRRSSLIQQKRFPSIRSSLRK